jgi:AraC-like DNA-binding protein
MIREVNFLKFDDFDRFREVLRGWDTEPTQLTSGPLAIHWDQLVCDDVVISRLRANRKIADRSSYQTDHVGFVVCLADKTFCGVPVSAGSLVVFGPGREYRSVLQEGWESFEIAMSNELFQSMAYASSVGRRIALGPERSVMPLSQQLVAQFREWSAHFLAPFRDRRGLLREGDWAEAVRERTLALLHAALCENGHVGAESSPLRHVQGWTLAVRALEFIDGRERDKLTIQQVSQAMGCTPRALQSAFQTTLGVTPLQYVLARRLHLARRDLLTRKNGLPSVTQAAADRGFMHFGRFSRYYTCLFGELPSATMQRARAIRSSS